MAWISGNRYLTQAEMENNAALIWEFLGSRGWTRNAVAALLGNMQYESSINPGIWQNLTPYEGGYGLVQWTPYTKYANWAGNQWENNGQLQLQRLVYEVPLTGEQAQWIPTSQYNYSFLSWTRRSNAVRTMTSAFMHNYERPASYDTEYDRGTAGLRWYYWLADEPAPPDVPTPDPEPTAEDQVKPWLLFGMNKWRQGFTVGKRFV